MRLKLSLYALTAIFLLGVAARMSSAATLTLSRLSRPVTMEEAAGGAPLGGFVHDFFVTSGSDLLSIGNVAIDVDVFQHEYGTDSTAPPSALAASTPAAEAHSYIAMPGNTVVLGGGFSSTGDKLWGDLSNDGPQQNFHFARLTVGATGSFAGEVALRGGGGPVSLPFNFLLPGNAADMGLLASEGTYSLEYSLDPPAPPPVVPPPVVPPPTAPPFVPSPPVNPPPSVDPPVGPPTTPATGSTGQASVTIVRQSRAVTADEIAGGAPAGGFVHEFRLTSATDLLSIAEVDVNVPLFQHSEGDDGVKPNAALTSIVPGLSAHSYITTPGETVMLGGGFTGGGEPLWGDLSNDGGQEDFLFASLTSGETGVFSGWLGVRSEGSFVKLPFELPMPSADAWGELGSTATYHLQPEATPPPPVVLPPETPVDPWPGPVEPAPVDPVVGIDPPGEPVGEIPVAYPLEVPIEFPLEWPAVIPDGAVVPLVGRPIIYRINGTESGEGGDVIVYPSLGTIDGALWVNRLGMDGITLAADGTTFDLTTLVVGTSGQEGLVNFVSIPRSLPEVQLFSDLSAFDASAFQQGGAHLYAMLLNSDAAVPEPTSGFLCGAGALLLMYGRRGRTRRRI